MDEATWTAPRAAERYKSTSRFERVEVTQYHHSLIHFGDDQVAAYADGLVPSPCRGRLYRTC